MSVYDDYSWNQLIIRKRKTLEVNGGQIPTSWGILSDDDGTKILQYVAKLIREFPDFVQIIEIH